MGFSDRSLLDIFRMGGVAMWPLLIASFLLVIVIWNRWVSLCFKTRRLREISDEFAGRIEDIVLKGGVREAITICEVTDSPLSRIFKQGLLKHDRSKEEFLKAIEVAIAQEFRNFKKHFWGLATIGNTAPFIGLFGTVVGIMRAFSDISASGSSGLNIVAVGISEALVATATGLVIAVCAVVAYNYFQTKALDLIEDLRTYSLRLIDLIGDRKGW
jgi:biopolymer transport protein ExbB